MKTTGTLSPAGVRALPTNVFAELPGDLPNEVLTAEVV